MIPRIELCNPGTSEDIGVRRALKKACTNETG
jgi:hypothetical protein